MSAEARRSSSAGISGLFDQGDARVSYAGASSARVLVIDDDPSMKHMLLNYLEQHDMRVSFASQRQEVVRPTMTHFFYMDERNPEKVKHWYGAVGPVSFG